jgi:hypothetical protein
LGVKPKKKKYAPIEVAPAPKVHDAPDAYDVLSGDDFLV